MCGAHGLVQAEQAARRGLPSLAAILVVNLVREFGDFTRWKEHDAYTKALDRLLRDLRVEKTQPPSSGPPGASYSACPGPERCLAAWG
jgi:hypothetical protein